MVPSKDHVGPERGIRPQDPQDLRPLYPGGINLSRYSSPQDRYRRRVLDDAMDLVDLILSHRQSIDVLHIRLVSD